MFALFSDDKINSICTMSYEGEPSKLFLFSSLFCNKTKSLKFA